MPETPSASSTVPNCLQECAAWTSSIQWSFALIAIILLLTLGLLLALWAVLTVWVQKQGRDQAENVEASPPASAPTPSWPTPAAPPQHFCELGGSQVRFRPICSSHGRATSSSSDSESSLPPWRRRRRRRPESDNTSDNSRPPLESNVGSRTSGSEDTPKSVAAFLVKYLQRPDALQGGSPEGVSRKGQEGVGKEDQGRDRSADQRPERQSSGPTEVEGPGGKRKGSSGQAAGEGSGEQQQDLDHPSLRGGGVPTGNQHTSGSLNI